MKKIIAAFDGINFSASTMEYAIDIVKTCNAHLVGVFLDDIIHHSYKFSELIDENGGVSDKKIAQLNEQDEETRKHSMNLFKSRCEKEGINFSVHRDRNVAFREVLHESIYSDLLIVSRKEDFNIYRDDIPSDFMRDVLTDAQCPVLIVPEKHSKIEKLVLLYDGAPSSVHAVKMFSYIMAPLKHMPAEVLSVKPEKGSLHVPDNRLMKEFMKRHFPRAEYTVLKGSPEEAIPAFLQEQKEEVLIVLGAYSRSKVSRWFRPSMADVLMSKLKLPLFIAHNK